MKTDKPKLFDEIIQLPRQHLRGLYRTSSKSQHLIPTHDRLFKENLKKIIRRKINYETHEFAVLKFFKRAELNYQTPVHSI
jgi:hypothetical protein